MKLHAIVLYCKEEFFLKMNHGAIYWRNSLNTDII